MNINGIYLLSILKIIGILILLFSLLFLKQKHNIKDNYENDRKSNIKQNNNIFKNHNIIYEKNESNKFKSADILTGSNELYPINSLDVDYGNRIENNIYCNRFTESP